MLPSSIISIDKSKLFLFVSSLTDYRLDDSSDKLVKSRCGFSTLKKVPLRLVLIFNSHETYQCHWSLKVWDGYIKRLSAFPLIKVKALLILSYSHAKCETVIACACNENCSCYGIVSTARCPPWSWRDGVGERCWFAGMYIVRPDDRRRHRQNGVSETIYQQCGYGLIRRH